MILVNGWKYTGGGGCSDIDALAYIALQATAGNTLTAPQQAAICQFYTDMKAAGLYTGFFAGGILKWGNAAYNNIGMVSGQPSASQTGSPTNGSTGIVFNGTSQYLNTQVATTLASQNNIGVGVNVVSGASSTYKVYIGSRASGNTTTTIGTGSNISTNTWVSLTAFNNSSLVTTPPTQFLYSSRAVSNLTTLYRNGASAGTTANGSQTPIATTLAVGALNETGSFNLYASCTISFWCVTRSYNSTEAGQFYTITNTLLTAL